MWLLRVLPYQYALGVAPFPARSAATIKPAHYPKAALSGAPPQVCFGSFASILACPQHVRLGDPICFSPYLYRARNLIERFFSKIKQCRRVATRYDKLAANYLAFVKLASIRIWLRANESAP